MQIRSSKKITAILVASLATYGFVGTTQAGIKEALLWGTAGTISGGTSLGLGFASWVALKMSESTEVESDIPAHIGIKLLFNVFGKATAVATGSGSAVTGSTSLYCFYKAWQNFKTKTVDK